MALVKYLPHRIYILVYLWSRGARSFEHSPVPQHTFLVMYTFFVICYHIQDLTIRPSNHCLVLPGHWVCQPEISGNPRMPGRLRLVETLLF